MDEAVLEVLASLVLAGVVAVDRWAIRNYELDETARSWCKAQFMFSSDPRSAVSVSSYVVGVVSVLLFVGAVFAFVGHRGG